MAWTWDQGNITFDSDCRTFDGADFCYSRAGAGYPVIYQKSRKPRRPYAFLDSLSIETVKEVAKKVEIYQQAEKTLTPEHVDAIVGAMVDTWDREDMLEKMALYAINQEAAVFHYKAAIRQLIEEEDLAMILILASI